jgi:hypothetical protein
VHIVFDAKPLMGDRYCARLKITTTSSSKAAGSTCTLGPDATSRRALASSSLGRGRPDQEPALRRLRAAFGFVELLRIIDHDQGLDQDEPIEQGE